MYKCFSWSKWKLKHARFLWKTEIGIRQDWKAIMLNCPNWKRIWYVLIFWNYFCFYVHENCLPFSNYAVKFFWNLLSGNDWFFSTLFPMAVEGLVCDQVVVCFCVFACRQDNSKIVDGFLWNCFGLMTYWTWKNLIIFWQWLTSWYVLPDLDDENLISLLTTAKKTTTNINILWMLNNAKRQNFGTNQDTVYTMEPDHQLFPELLALLSALVVVCSVTSVILCSS